jgi:predicted kinase
MSEIIMLVGMPCAGKSTYLSTRDDLKDYEIVSSDNILEEKAKEMGKTYTEAFPIYGKQANKLFYKQLDEAIAAGKNIIVDRTNMSVGARKNILDKVGKNYKKTCFNFSITMEMAKERNLKRAETGKFIPEKVLASMRNSYQKPTTAEGFDEIVEIDTTKKDMVLSKTSEKIQKNKMATLRKKIQTKDLPPKKSEINLASLKQKLAFSR